MWRTPLPASASYKGMIAPPGYPKTRSAPSARKQRKTISAPLSMDRLGSRSIRGFVFFLLRRQPRHHAAQPRADFFDGMFLFHVAEDGEVASALLVFVDPFASEGAVLDAGENLFHGSARRIANHAITAGQIAILGRVGNRVTHPAQPAFVNQVDDQLHLMQTLEVGDLRLISGFHQRLKTFLDERCETTAEHRLLAEEIAFGFFPE